jgi:hypothetical protein
MEKYILFALALICGCFVSCEEEKNAKIEVWLTDDPGDYQEVNIDLQAVEIHSNEIDNERGWQSLDVSPRIYNLLQLTNGTETLLGELELPGGRISQIRLKLGENNTLKVNDVVYPLNTPSAQQSGLKLQIHKVLTEGITYKILLDFDAAKSVVHAGNDSYSLKPVIRTLTEAQDGAIKGKVNPEGMVSIAVMKGEETVTTTSSNDAGEFLVRGLEPGTYRLLFDAPGDGPIVEKTGILVELGVVRDLGIVTVSE